MTKYLLHIHFLYALSILWNHISHDKNTHYIGDSVFAILTKYGTIIYNIPKIFWMTYIQLLTKVYFIGHALITKKRESRR